jgi:hypothetical protein
LGSSVVVPFFLSLIFRTEFIVIPRAYVRGELHSKSDLNEGSHVKLAELGFVFIVHDVKELKTTRSRLDSLKVGFDFDNILAVHIR